MVFMLSHSDNNLKLSNNLANRKVDEEGEIREIVESQTQRSMFLYVAVTRDVSAKTDRVVQDDCKINQFRDRRRLATFDRRT